MPLSGFEPATQWSSTQPQDYWTRLLIQSCVLVLKSTIPVSLFIIWFTHCSHLRSEPLISSSDVYHPPPLLVLPRKSWDVILLSPHPIPPPPNWYCSWGCCQLLVETQDRLTQVPGVTMQCLIRSGCSMHHCTPHKHYQTLFVAVNCVL